MRTLPAALGLESLPNLYSTIFADSGVALQAGLRYGPHRRHILDVYRPAPDQLAGPLAVFIYGGGWRKGDRATYGFVGTALAARGITTVIPDYRLYPEVRFATFVEDAARAYGWTSKTLAPSPGRRRPIFLIGHSAGGHIAALLAYDSRYLAANGGTEDPPAGLVGLAGPYAYDLTTYPPTVDIFAGANAREVQPVTFVRAGAPRSLLLHGLKDETVQLANTRKLADALMACGTPVRKIELAGIGHVGLVLAISKPLRWRAPVLREMVDFIGAAARG